MEIKIANNADFDEILQVIKGGKVIFDAEIGEYFDDDLFIFESRLSKEEISEFRTLLAEALND